MRVAPTRCSTCGGSALSSVRAGHGHLDRKNGTFAGPGAHRDRMRQQFPQMMDDRKAGGGRLLVLCEDARKLLLGNDELHRSRADRYRGST